jgi:cell division protease FtsH
MVREFGMSPTLGPVGYPEGGSVFLGGGGPGLSSRPYAEATQAAIDAEVSKLLRQAEVRAVDLLRAHREDLDALVDLLLERETVDGSDVYRMAGRPDRSQPVSGTASPPVDVAPHAADDAANAGDSTSNAGDSRSAR